MDAVPSTTPRASVGHEADARMRAYDRVRRRSREARARGQHKPLQPAAPVLPISHATVELMLRAVNEKKPGRQRRVRSDKIANVQNLVDIFVRRGHATGSGHGYIKGFEVAQVLYGPDEVVTPADRARKWGSVRRWADAAEEAGLLKLELVCDVNGYVDGLEWRLLDPRVDSALSPAVVAQLAKAPPTCTLHRRSETARERVERRSRRYCRRTGRGSVGRPVHGGQRGAPSLFSRPLSVRSSSSPLKGRTTSEAVGARSAHMDAREPGRRPIERQRPVSQAAATHAKRRRTAARVRAALEERVNSGLGSEDGFAVVEALPFLARVPIDLLAKVAAEVYAPELDRRMSAKAQNRLEVGARRMKRYGNGGNGAPLAPAERVLNVLMHGTGRKWPHVDGEAKSLGALSVVLLRIGNDWRRHHKQQTGTFTPAASPAAVTKNSSGRGWTRPAAVAAEKDWGYE